MASQSIKGNMSIWMTQITNDYKAALNYFCENEAHKFKPGRQFGDYDLPADLTSSFDRAKFFRWITEKNSEAANILNSRKLPRATITE